MPLSNPDEVRTSWFNAAPFCNVKHSAAQTISTSSFTTLAFDTDETNKWGMHDTVTNNSRITIDVPGAYLVTVSFSWDNNSTGNRLVRLKKNGTFTFADQKPAAAFSQTNIAWPIRTYARDDYLEIEVWQDSGGDLDVLTAATFAVQWIQQP